MALIIAIGDVNGIFSGRILFPHIIFWYFGAIPYPYKNILSKSSNFDFIIMHNSNIYLFNSDLHNCAFGVDWSIGRVYTQLRLISLNLTCIMKSNLANNFAVECLTNEIKNWHIFFQIVYIHLHLINNFNFTCYFT